MKPFNQILLTDRCAFCFWGIVPDAIVIDDDDEMKNVIKNCMDLTRGYTIFTVYEKDKSGNGQETKPDCYQRNQPIVFYQNVIESMGYNVERVDGMLVVSK